MEIAQKERLASVIENIIRRNTSTDLLIWLQQKVTLINEENDSTQLNLTFAIVPRKTGRQLINIHEEENEIIAGVHKEFSIADYTIDRLCRLWLLMQIQPADENTYLAKIESLFKAAEMHEAAALYSSLFFLQQPLEWRERCAEGIRSNIGIVLEAIMYNNPYPFAYLNDLAWNQLVMKAFFTEKDINRIIGLDERANKELASILIDYAAERWAAHRVVNPLLWRPVAKFIDESNFDKIEKAFKSVDIREKKAAALACFYSNYLPAKEMLESEPVLKSAIIANKLSWSSL